MARISQAKHRRNYNKIHAGRNRATMNPTSGNQVSIFPFEIILGAINVTNTGNVADNTIISDYVHYEKVFTGLENVVARWEGAYKVELVNDDDLFLTKTVQVGRNIKAIYQNKEAGTNFENSPVSDDFANMLTNERYTLNIYEEFSLADQFKLYIIPELSGEKWLRVVSARFPKQGVKGGHVELVLETVNNDIATSGRAVQQFIQTGGAGEGHAWPVVVNSDTITLDEARLKDVPTTTMQLEVAGSFPITTLYAYGRPEVRGDDGGTVFNPRIEAPRLLLPYRIETPTPSAQNTRPTAVADYYVGNFLPTQWRQHADWRERLVGDTYYDARAKDEGLLISEKLKSDIVSSNPISQGTRQFILWDNAWVFNVEKVYDTRPDPYTEDDLTLTGDYSIPELLAHNFFGTSPIEALPKEITSNITYGFRDVPLVGGFLNTLTAGINPKFNNQAYRFGIGAIPMLIPADTVEYGNVLMGRGADDQTQEVFMPMDIFTGKGSGVETEVNSDISSQGTILRTQLTHRFSKTIGGQDYIFDTQYLGQAHPATDDDGKVIPLPPAKLLWDDTCSPTNRGDIAGYVIDLYGFKGIGKYDYRMSFYSNDIPVFQATYQTQGRFTNSMRDWTNTVKLTKWEEDNQRSVKFPEAIVQPDPPDTNNPIITVEDIVAQELQEYNGFFINNFTQLNKNNAWLLNQTGINYVNNFENQNISNFTSSHLFEGWNPIQYWNWNNNTLNIDSISGILQYDTTENGGFTNFLNTYENIQFDVYIDNVLQNNYIVSIQNISNGTTTNNFDFKSIEVEGVIAGNATNTKSGLKARFNYRSNYFLDLNTNGDIINIDFRQEDIKLNTIRLSNDPFEPDTLIPANTDWTLFESNLTQTNLFEISSEVASTVFKKGARVEIRNIRFNPIPI